MGNSRFPAGHRLTGDIQPVGQIPLRQISFAAKTIDGLTNAHTQPLLYGFSGFIIRPGRETIPAVNGALTSGRFSGILKFGWVFPLPGTCPAALYNSDTYTGGKGHASFIHKRIGYPTTGRHRTVLYCVNNKRRPRLSLSQRKQHPHEEVSMASRSRDHRGDDRTGDTCLCICSQLSALA